MSRSRRELFGFHRPADTPVHRAPLALKASGVAVISVLLMLPFPWLLRRLGIEAPENRVVLQQVSQSLVVGEVVDGHNLHIGTRSHECTEVVTANSAEAVDSNLDGHFG